MDYSLLSAEASGWIAHSPYLGVFVISLWDRIGIPGALVAATATSSAFHLQLLPTLFLVILGSFLGDHVFYFGGLLMAPRIAGARRRFPAAGRMLDSAANLLSQYPRSALIWGRFIPKAGKYLSGVAGLASFPYSQFLPITILSSIAYGSLFGTAAFLGGNLLGHQSPAVQATGIAVALALTGMIAYRSHWRKSRA